MSPPRSPRLRRAVLSACSATALLLTGCASIDSAPPRFAAGETALSDADKYFAKVLDDYAKATDDAKRAAIRNAFIETRAALIDQAYSGFRQTMYSQRVGMNVGVDLATLGLAAAGAATASEQAKTGLHALSGALIGSKASIDKNVFFDRTLQALLAQMEAMRGTVRLRLLAGMGEGTQRYPLMQARADIEEYYLAGSVLGAIGGITNQALNEQKASSDALARRLPSSAQVERKLQGLQVDVATAAGGDDPGRQLNQCVTVSNATVAAANERAVLAWARANVPTMPAGETGFTLFLIDARFAGDRAKAAADPALKSALKGCSLAAG